VSEHTREDRVSWSTCRALVASLCCVGSVGIGSALAGPVVPLQPVRIFAASSLTDALNEVGELWRARGAPAPVLVYGGSAMLARQIEAGAPADVYVTADPRWMDHLAQRGHVDARSRNPLLGNELVLVAPRGQGFAISMKPGWDLASAFDGRLCMGEPDVVPAGTYAREALQSLGWWKNIAGRVVGTDDVRTALAFVERRECAAGIVYATDARASDKVVVLARFPARSHAPIRYEFALVSGARPAARRLLEALRSDSAVRDVFVRHGFTVLAVPATAAGL
jgi:molybdate transport system substrate-binding protein